MSKPLAEYAEEQGRYRCQLRNSLPDELLHEINANKGLRPSLIERWLLEEHGITLGPSMVKNHLAQHTGGCVDV